MRSQVLTRVLLCHQDALWLPVSGVCRHSTPRSFRYSHHHARPTEMLTPSCGVSAGHAPAEAQEPLQPLSDREATSAVPLTYGITLLTQREASLGPQGLDVGLPEEQDSPRAAAEREMVAGSLVAGQPRWKVAWARPAQQTQGRRAVPLVWSAPRRPWLPFAGGTPTAVRRSACPRPSAKLCWELAGN